VARRAAAQKRVDRILKGEKRAIFRCSHRPNISLSLTAKAFGLVAPTALLARADEVIKWPVCLLRRMSRFLACHDQTVCPPHHQLCEDKRTSNDEYFVCLMIGLTGLREPFYRTFEIGDNGHEEIREGSVFRRVQKKKPRGWAGLLTGLLAAGE